MFLSKTKLFTFLVAFAVVKVYNKKADIRDFTAGEVKLSLNNKKNIFLLIYYSVTLALSILLSALIVKVDPFSYDFLYTLIVDLFVLWALCILLHLHAIVLKQAGLAVGIKVTFTVLVLFLVNALLMVFLKDITFNWCLTFCMVYFLFVIFVLFVVRILHYLDYRILAKVSQNKKRAIVVGAGSAGAMLIKEMQSSDKLDLFPCCCLDDDKEKRGSVINDVKVVGTVDEVGEYVKKYDAQIIIIAMPSVRGEKLKRIYELCRKTNLKVLTLPGIYQFVTEQVSVSKLRNVDVQDLLGREPVRVNIDEIMGYIDDKIVLVTGGGGSIGSELCRQIASHNPKQLIIFDIYENNAYDIEQELKRTRPQLNLLVLIGSVRDSVKLDNMFDKYRPEIVFHAAAHKHVPLMETSPNEAVKNNVCGTYKLAKVADKYGVKRFVQISTDKAVNPTNIMGATKRICEMIVQTMDKHSKTEFVAVRFGNVLGSNGSVIPLFKKQIENGGPVTVTHKDIVRYFMTIPEAVSLVLQAGAYAKGGEIFVLDMGEPVKIYDLAYNLIKMSGYEPNVDIQIVCTGLRPGEKLYEERLMKEEGLQRTENKLISIGKPLDIDEEKLFKTLDLLYDAAYAEAENMKDLVHELVPTYKIDRRS